MMKTRIALINVHSNYNAGDAALTMAALDQLYASFPNSDITLVMNDPDSYSGNEKVLISILTWLNRPGVTPFLRFAWLILLTLPALITHRILAKPVFLPFSKDIQPTLDALINSDLVVSVPGGYYYSYGKGRAFLYLNFSLLLPLIANQPLYMLPQSYGPLRHNWEKKIARWILNRAQIVMAREPGSFQFLQGLGVNPKKVYLLPDMAFAYQGKKTGFGQQWLKEVGIGTRYNRPLLGMTVLDWGAQYNYFSQQRQFENAILDGINHFIEKYHGTVVLFPQCSGPSAAEDDRIPSMKLKKASRFSQNIIAIETPLTADQLISAYSQMEIFIGTRMHSNIFALINFIPVIAVGYLHKTNGIATMAGIEDWVLDINEISSSEFIQTIDAIVNKREEYVSHLKERIPRLSSEAKNAGLLIWEDFTNIQKTGKK